MHTFKSSGMLKSLQAKYMRERKRKKKESVIAMQTKKTQSDSTRYSKTNNNNI